MELPQLDLGFRRHGPRTVFDRRRFAWPYVLTRSFALDPDRPHLQTVIVQTSSGAMHGDDRLRQRLALGPGAAVHLTTQGAASVHRADPGLCSSETLDLDLAAGALLEYLPQPRILFPGARLLTAARIDCAPGAMLLLADAFTLHDPGGSGQLFARFTSETLLRLGGETRLLDRFDIEGLPRHFARHRAFGTLLLVAPLPAEPMQAACLALNHALADSPGLYGAASLLPGAIGIGLRLAAAELRQVRQATDLALGQLRPMLPAPG
jgi:urease accessory protein